MDHTVKKFDDCDESVPALAFSGEKGEKAY
jgi:hypothetical protein